MVDLGRTRLWLKETLSQSLTSVLALIGGKAGRQGVGGGGDDTRNPAAAANYGGGQVQVDTGDSSAA